MGKKANSLQDIADIAGVSRATVSRALNDSPLISESTKTRIRALAQDHNYRVSRKARNFRLQKTGIITVVFMLDADSQQHMSDPFFLEMLGAIADTLAAHDYDLLLAHAPIADVRDLTQGGVLEVTDGAIFIGQGDQHDALNEIAASGKPIAVWGEEMDKRSYALVGGDNLKGGYLATRHLLELGRRRIAFFGNTHTPENTARFVGYERALKEYQLDVDQTRVVDLTFDSSDSGPATQQIAQQAANIDGIICASDVMALSTISIVTEMGFKVPDDIAIVGYDNIQLSVYSSPPLTTVSQNIAKAGNALAQTLLKIISGDHVGDTQVDIDLEVRKSCGYKK